MITNDSQLINALANNASRFVIDKTFTAAPAGGFMSMWRAAGTPGQGAIPTTPAPCQKSLTGALGFTTPASPASSYLGWASLAASNAAFTIEVHDRIAHMGGLVLNVATLQTVGLDPVGLGVASDRIGSSDFSNLQWWIEVYAAGGATASNATINVEYNDGSAGSLNTQAVGGTLALSRMLPLNSLIPSAKSGLYIARIVNVTLSVSTGTAGNVGFTVTRPRTTMPLNVASKSESFDWANLGLPKISNDACLQLITLNTATTAGWIRGSAKLIHG